jgi:hypothetical protein
LLYAHVEQTVLTFGALLKRVFNKIFNQAVAAGAKVVSATVLLSHEVKL